MNLISASSVTFSCAILLGAFFHQSTALAQNRRSIGRFTRDGVIAAITPGNITVTHDDGQQIDYSTHTLTDEECDSVVVKGRLPLSFIDPGVVLSASVKMSPSGKAQESVSELTFVNDQARNWR